MFGKIRTLARLLKNLAMLPEIDRKLDRLSRRQVVHLSSAAPAASAPRDHVVRTDRIDQLEVLAESCRGWTSLEELRALAQHASEASETIVEIGMALGRSGIALALGSQRGHGAPVYSVDPQERFTGVLGGNFGPWDRTEAFFQFLRFQVTETLRVVNLPSLQVAQSWNRPIGLLFIDGDHRLEAVRADVEAWSPYIVVGGVVVLDDARTAEIGPGIVADELARSVDFEEIPAPGKFRAFVRRS